MLCRRQWASPEAASRANFGETHTFPMKAASGSAQSLFSSEQPASTETKPQNGATATGAETPPMRQLTAEEVQFSVAFTRVVAVLMRSKPYRQFSLGSLESLVVPALMTGQFAIADANINGQVVPVAVAFWANVSAEVDQRLSDPGQKMMQLKPDDWRSGEIPWLIDAVGDGNVIPHLLQRLTERAFAGREVKTRRTVLNGGVTIGTLNEHMGE